MTKAFASIIFTAIFSASAYANECVDHLKRDPTDVIYVSHEGTFHLDVKSVEDVAIYKEEMRNEFWDYAKNLMTSEEEGMRIFYSSLREQKAAELHGAIINIRMVHNGIKIVYDNPNGRVSAHSPAKFFHFFGGLGVHFLLSSENFLKSLSQLHHLDDVQSQREWMAVTLLDEAAKWPQHRANAKQLDILDGQIHSIAIFDRMARKHKVSYASPFRVGEHIALSKIWLDHYLSFLEEDRSSSELRFAYVAAKAPRAQLLEDALTVHENLYEIWQSSENISVQKNLANMIDDAQLLIETLFAQKYPYQDMHTSPMLRDVYESEADIHQVPPKLVVEPTIEADPEVAETEIQYDTDFTYKAAPVEVETAPTQAVEQAPLILTKRGMVELANNGAGNAEWVFRLESPKDKVEAWTIKLSQKSQKKWDYLQNFSGSKGKLFFSRMTQAFRQILENGYYQSIGKTGFPNVKRLNLAEDTFEFLWGGENRVIFRVDSKAQAIYVIDLSENHNVGYE